jgi:hypothetical protein
VDDGNGAQINLLPLPPRMVNLTGVCKPVSYLFQERAARLLITRALLFCRPTLRFLVVPLDLKAKLLRWSRAGVATKQHPVDWGWSVDYGVKLPRGERQRQPRWDDRYLRPAFDLDGTAGDSQSRH